VADAMWTDQPKVGLCIMTADCLPVFIADSNARIVAMVHGGWRSLVGGIIQKLSANFDDRALKLRAWIGPGISFASYPVGSELRDEICSAYGDKIAFQVCREHKGAMHADLSLLTQHCLAEADIEYCGVSSTCNYLDKRFYSHRRASLNAKPTGRMASVIWIK
jgi:YfiH family protein